MRVLTGFLLPLVFASVAAMADQRPNAAPPDPSVPSPKTARAIGPNGDAGAGRERVAALIREGRAAVPKALELLQSDDPRVRAAGIFVLRSVGAKGTVTKIINILTNDRSDAVRLQAAEALGAFGAPESVAGLVRVIATDENRDVRVRAIAALGRIDAPDVVAPIRDALKNPRSENEYQSAAVAAGQRRIMAAEAELITASTDVDRTEHSRSAAVLALGLMRSSTARDTVLNLTRDRSPVVRFNAVAALDEMGDERGAPRVLQVFNDSSEEDYIRIRAASAMAALGTPECLTALRLAVAGPDEFMAMHSLVALLQNEPSETRRLAEQLRARAKDPFVVHIAARVARGQSLPWGQR